MSPTTMLQLNLNLSGQGASGCFYCIEAEFIRFYKPIENSYIGFMYNNPLIFVIMAGCGAGNLDGKGGNSGELLFFTFN